MSRSAAPGRDTGVRAREASPHESARWDELVEATGRPHLLQSAGWAEVKAAAREEVAQNVWDEMHQPDQP